MSKGALTLFALAAAGVAGWIWADGATDSPPERQARVSLSADRAVAEVPASAETRERAQVSGRVFSAKMPLLRHEGLQDIERADAATPVPNRWAAVTVTTREHRPTAQAAPAPPPAKRMSSLEPGDGAARAQLVRDIQYELKRAGCYGGVVNGAWTTRTKHAMQEFTQRVNASLRTDQPDYALLALTQGHNVIACSTECPAGHVATHEGRCLPSAMLARRGSGVTMATSGEAGAAPLSAGPVLPGRMAVGAANGRAGDVPTDSVLPRSDAILPAVVDARPSVIQPAARSAPPRRSAYGRSRKGSTRRVFTNLMRNAP